MQTIQQKRAAAALAAVREASSELSGDDRKKYKSYASQFPAMIRMNGLGPAAAFFRGKDELYKSLYDTLGSWLRSENGPYYGVDDLMDGITTRNQNEYRMAQVEAVVFMEWVKKLANAFMEEPVNSTVQGAGEAVTEDAS
ncbi:MAG: type III-B CRISPR module-associated protein Cmr5 [Nitrospirae bacterium]|nr:type III-B CRISPR module-associated protein Cmr5 [Nitrospirota bacterium]